MLFTDEFRSIQKTSFGEYKEKGSLFKAYAVPVSTELQVKASLAQIKEEHPKANHHCYAFVLGPGQQSYRFNDDHEPSGTAGRPIYNAIKSADLTNILIVVVRYFGGTLLGVQGLIRSYRSAAENAIDKAEIITTPITELFSIAFPYERTGDIENLLVKSKAAVLDRKMEQQCTWTVEIPKAFAQDVFNQIANKFPLKIDCIISRI
jgi:uncharacterized YigZ family protein